MIRKSLVNIGVAALLGGVAVAAQAAVTLQTTGAAYGTLNRVKVPGYNGWGGAFTGIVAGASNSSFNKTFEMYCVELAQNIEVPGGPFIGFSIETAAAILGASRSNNLARLLTYALPIVDTHAESTSLQLAIWNVLAETDLTVNGGNFKDTFGGPGGEARRSEAGNYLAGMNGLVGPSKYDLYVLKSAAYQDQLIWTSGIGRGVGAGADVPEPTSLALAFGALGALGLATRRRKTTKA